VKWETGDWKRQNPLPKTPYFFITETT